MYLNKLKPAKGSKHAPKRVGRGIGSGLGKTSARGHKGQHARSGGYHKVGFEGGQMPLQRRLPKFGFNSRKARLRAEVRLSDLNNLPVQEVDLLSLKAAGLIHGHIETAKIILKGEISKAFTIASGILVTAGAKAAIEAAGGKVQSE